MAKKNLNPADSYRKAQRKKELKKARSKARDFALVKKDTWDLEDEIARLEVEEDTSENTRLAELKAELEKINKKKAEYVTEHPEQRRLVYKPRRKEGANVEDEPILLRRNLFNKNGLPRHPERSVYYDPVMNPFGVAPPGMPYLERSPKPGEVYSDEEEENSDDSDEIPLPPGPPPGTEEVDSDDDIPMPEGPPPDQSKQGMFIHLSIDLDLTLHKASTSSLHPQPPIIPLPPRPPPTISGLPLPPPPGNIPYSLPPPGFPIGSLPPLPPGFLGEALPPLPLPPPPGFTGVGLPPPPPGFPQIPIQGYVPHALPNFPPPGLPLPPPPAGFFPRRSQSASSMQDPLSTIPHQTYQAHRAGQSTLPSHPSLPPNPTKNTAGPVSLGQNDGAEKPSAKLVAATVFATPQLRDFKKEATAFVPTALKRKRTGAAGTGTSTRIDAAPSDLGAGVDTNTEGPTRPDLLSTLKNQFGPTPPASKNEAIKGKNEPKLKKVKNDDYEKFIEEMGDILGQNK
ncbi:mRNA biogenesis factor-domain-containing protein [Collybia nuda]|uniref:mRNA biogenesis factor-domain-containing protein n=1 Tax=Collybia nuda TaxID=64659 RepID=A0A9P6CR48_9AGAR|nr:mRNA biogenesis factor-domain-containing protein [Collybia nuda]